MTQISQYSIPNDYSSVKLNQKNDKTIENKSVEEKPKQETSVIKDEKNLQKISSANFDNSFKFNVNSKKEGGEGLSSSNPDSLAGKFYANDNVVTRPQGLTDKVDLSSKESRVKFTNSTTQLEATASVSNEYGCGAACIVNGAMVEKGKDGLLSLTKVIEKRGKDSYEDGGTINTKTWKQIPGWDKLDGIKDRINNNTVTRQDLLDLQKIVYHQLRHMENPNRSGGDGTPSINIDRVRDYINTDTSLLGGLAGSERPLQSTMANTNIKLLDTDGDRSNSEHFVLFMNTENGSNENAVFDPWPRKEGNQIVKDSNQLLEYHHSVLNAVR